MSAFIVTDEEMEALYSVGPLAFTLYIWLRSWMDFDTGVVGLSRPISLGMLATYCERHINRGLGQQIQKPTQKDVRMAIDGLMRAGVMERRAGECLVFRLVLAQTGNMRSKQTGHSAGTVRAGVTGHSAGMASSRVDTGHTDDSGTHSGHSAGRVERDEPGTHQRSEIRDRDDDDDDRARDLSDIPEIPTQPAQWLAYFNRAHDTGFRPDSIHDRKPIWPVFQRWIAAGISLKRVDEAIRTAHASAKGPISNLPLYVDRVLASMEKPVRQGGGEARAARMAESVRVLTGGLASPKGGGQTRFMEGAIDGTAERLD